MHLPPKWELPDSIKVRFGKDSAGKQRAMYHEEHLLLVMHEAPQESQDAGQAVFFWRKPDGEWDFSGRGQGLHALENHVEEYERRADDLRGQYKLANTADDSFQLLEELAPMVRASKNMLSTLQAARESVRLENEIIRLRDRAYEIERGLDLLYTDTKNALDLCMARQAERQARLGQQAVHSAHRLNILAALFFPVMAMAGLLGMNMQSGLEKLPTIFFWATLGIGTMVGFIMCWWVLRPPKQDDAGSGG